MIVRLIIILLGIYSIVHHDPGVNLMFDPFSLLIAGILSSIKLNQKAVQMKNQSDSAFMDSVTGASKKAAGSMNRYLPEDLNKYMNFLNSYR